MRRPWIVALAGLVATTAGGSAASARTEAPMIVAADTSVHPDVSLVVDLPTELGGSDVVTVLEGGDRRTASIVRGPGALEVAVVVDTSGSMTGAPLVAAKAAAAELVDRLPDGARASLIGFGQHPYVVTPMTDDRGAVRGGIGGLVAAGETALYDALAVGAAQFSPGRNARSVVLVSDGGDTVSSKTLAEVTQVLRDEHVRVFGVHLVTTEAQQAVLEDLAAATSGRFVAASSVADLGSAYAAVATDVVRQARVTYRSEAGGATPVSVLVGPDEVRSNELLLELPPLPVATPTAPVGPAPEAGDAGSALVVGGVCVFLGLVALWSFVLIRPRRSLLARRRRSSSAVRGQLKARAGEVVERTLERQGRRSALGARLEVAGVALRPGEYVVLVSGAVLLAFLTGAMLGGAVLGLALAATALVLAKVLLRSRTSKRQSELEKQLPDLLQQLISSLRAGYGVMQAIDAASKEMADPMAGELHRLFTEVQLGRELTESLRALADRLAGQDFEWVVQAIEINREVGGELVEVLESVAETIRARDHLRRQVKTLTAQGRLSARILLAMPFAMAALLSVLSPGYLTPLFTRGRFVVVAGAALMTTGWAWTRRLVRPQF